jgi:hypothetical protein
VVAPEESGRCCSFSTERVSETEVRCIPRP